MELFIRYLESAVRCTSYYEVDETEDSRSARKCVRQVEDVNELSDIKSAIDRGQSDTWNIREDDELVIIFTLIYKLNCKLHLHFVKSYFYLLNYVHSFLVLVRRTSHKTRQKTETFIHWE